jgi:hypothetical protein
MTMNMKHDSLFRPLLHAATLATGFGTIWFLLAVWIGSSLREAWPGDRRPVRERLVVTADGTPLIESVPLDNLSLVTYRDLDGNEHDMVESKNQIPAVYLYGRRETRFPFPSQPSWQQRIKVFINEREPAALWYFVHDGRPQGSGYFVGYERISNRVIGYIGLSGFRPVLVPPDDRIPVNSDLILGYEAWSSSPVWIDSGARMPRRPERWDLPPRLVHVPSGKLSRLVDLAARTVETIFESPEPIMSEGVPTLTSFSGFESTSRRPILVRAGSVIFKLDHEYNVIGTFTIPPEVNRSAAITWFEASDGRSVAEIAEPRKASEPLDQSFLKTRLLRIAQDGTIGASLELTLKTGANYESEQSTLFLMALALPAPALQLALQSFLALVGEPGHVEPGTLGAMLQRTWPSLLAVFALSSLLAALAWRRARAFGLSRREQAVWAGFVLLFGVPGCVGFLLHRRWPVREPCPNCQARSPRDRETCAECGAPFPAPAPKGIEIFA